MFQYVFLTGGCASFPNFKERLEHELLAMRPFQSEFHVYQAKNPVLDTWYGAKHWAQNQEQLEKYSVSKKEYEEKGGEYLMEHCISNQYFPTPIVETIAETVQTWMWC